jgi:hypothetical protein
MLRQLKRQVATYLECLKEDLGFWAHYRHRRPGRPDRHAILRDLRVRGYHVLRGYYDRAACAELARIIDALVAEFPDRIEVDPEQSDHRVWGGERAAPMIREFHADPALTELAEAYLKTPVVNITTLAAKMVARPGSRGSGGGWHRDSMYEKQFKAILYLSNAGPDNGPFQFVAGSHGKWSVCRTLPLGHPANLKRFTDADVTAWCARTGNPIDTLTGAAGDLILVDTRGIHRGKPIAAGARYALTNYYFPAHKAEQMGRLFAEVIKF